MTAKPAHIVAADQAITRARRLRQRPPAPMPPGRPPCAGQTATMWPTSQDEQITARNICAGCPDPRAAACLDLAMTHETGPFGGPEHSTHRSGIYAGLTGWQRYDLDLAERGRPARPRHRPTEQVAS